MLANALTLSRLLFLTLSVYLLHVPSFNGRLAALALIIFTIVIDAIDGMVARSQGESTTLGAVLDIAIDRVVENVYWITFVSLQLVPLWIALVFATRGILTDAVRGFALGHGFEPFEMMRSRLGRWLVSHRFMRGLYGVVKAVTFPVLALLHALRLVDFGAAYLPTLELLTIVLVGSSVTLNLLRGIPVLYESRRFFMDTAKTERPRS